MCVILACKESRPSGEMVERAFLHNNHGAGIAWRQTDTEVVRNAKGQEKEVQVPYVYWRKGLGMAEIQQAVAEAPLPFIVHCRIKSIGPQTPDMCHPFPIQKDASTALEGKTRGAVLFHNGTWHKWKDWVLEAAVRSQTKVPTGNWNDSRGMAFIAEIYGIGVLEFLDEKIAVIGPDAFEFFGSNWVEEDNICLSNRFFLNGSKSTYRAGGRWENGTWVEDSDESPKALTSGTSSSEPKAGGTSAPTSFRRGHGAVSQGEDLEETVETISREDEEDLEASHLRQGETSKGKAMIRRDDPTIVPNKSGVHITEITPPLSEAEKRVLRTITGVDLDSTRRSILASDGSSDRRKMVAAIRANISYQGRRRNISQEFRD